MHDDMRRITRLGALAAVFAAGVFCGSVMQRNAGADMKDLGSAVMKEAAGSQGGALGSAAKLGTAISDMQTQVDGLQRNLKTLNEIKAALGG